MWPPAVGLRPVCKDRKPVLRSPDAASLTAPCSHTDSSASCSRQALTDLRSRLQYKTPDIAARCSSLVRVNVYKDQVANTGRLPSLPGHFALAARLAEPYHRMVNGYHKAPGRAIYALPAPVLADAAVFQKVRSVSPGLHMLHSALQSCATTCLTAASVTKLLSCWLVLCPPGLAAARLLSLFTLWRTCPAYTLG